MPRSRRAATRHDDGSKIQKKSLTTHNTDQSKSTQQQIPINESNLQRHQQQQQNYDLRRPSCQQQHRTNACRAKSRHRPRSHQITCHQRYLRIEGQCGARVRVGFAYNANKNSHMIWGMNSPGDLFSHSS